MLKSLSQLPPIFNSQVTIEKICFTEECMSNSHFLTSVVLKQEVCKTWRRDFGVDTLTEDSVKGIAVTGKAYLHTDPDIEGRPVVVVVAANHVPARDDLIESEKLCIYLIEKALSQLPPGKDKILGIFDLRGFTSKNGDLKFVKFLVDVFFNYYPKRLDQVLFVEAPFIFQPGWNMVKPWLKSYASLVRFCTVEVVRQEYFTADTVPSGFKVAKVSDS